MRIWLSFGFRREHKPALKSSQLMSLNWTLHKTTFDHAKVYCMPPANTHYKLNKNAIFFLSVSLLLVFLFRSAILFSFAIGIICEQVVWAEWSVCCIVLPVWPAYISSSGANTKILNEIVSSVREKRKKICVLILLWAIINVMLWRLERYNVKTWL